MGDRIQVFLGSVSLADVLEQRFDGSAQVAAE
jgi:hypothetical protein